MSKRIWVDVEDLFDYVRENPRPSGIQRIEYELCRSFASLAETRDIVRFVRHSSARNSFHVIPYHTVEKLYSSMTAPDAAAGGRGQGDDAAGAAGEGAAIRWRRGLYAAVKRGVYRLPETVRAPLIQVLIHQRAALRALLTVIRAGSGGVLRASRARMAGGTARRPPGASTDLAAGSEGADDFARDAGPGDLLVVLGSPWFHPAYAAVVRKAQQERGIRFAMLLYDIIPLRRPEWCDKGLIALFDAWIRSVLPLVDVLLTISRASADDVVRYAAETGMSLRAAPVAIPIGTGFTKPPGRTVALALAPPPSGAAPRPSARTLPPAGSFALIVCTIEARKNHILLFRVWRRLLEEMAPADIPTLVFAGRVGWLVADLMEQLRNADYLKGKIVLVRDPTDAELISLYRGCRFTLFPSFYEGWGLPVTESLGFGRPCIVSNATSLPEAGGTLARYFDPNNGAEAYRVIRDTITDPAGLAAWQARVARDFVPVTWDQSARAIYQAFGLAETVGVRVAVGG